MKNLLAVLLAFSASWALQAPYLISATAVTDTSVQLSWRNNDAASTGFIVLRKDTTATAYKMIDSVKSATQLTYLDLKGLKPSKLYTYQVKAYSASAVSDTSNKVQVTTPAAPVIPDTFVAPNISIVQAWNYDTSKSLQIKIADGSNCETGYHVYRSAGASAVFNLISEIVSAQPKSKDTIIIKDTAVATNTWYRYQAAAYRGSNSIVSAPCSTFTFRNQRPPQIAKFTKLSNFPIADSAGWAAKSGDSIILRENNAPAGKFTAINIKNPASPQFAGYIDSTVLISYPMQTLIPVFLKFGVRNGYSVGQARVFAYNNNIVVTKDSITRLYQISGNSLTSIDSFKQFGVAGILQANGEQLFMASNTSHTGGLYDTTYLNILEIAASGFIKSRASIGNTFTSYGLEYLNYTPYLRGSFSNAIIIPVSWRDSVYNTGIGSLWKITRGQYVNVFSGNLYNENKMYGQNQYSLTINTGHYLSATQFLSQDTNHIYAEDIVDLNAYQTALSNNAVLPDSFHSRQNVLVDTVNKRLYILYKTNMSIFSYTFITVGVKNDFSKQPLLRNGELRVLPGSSESGVIIVFPGTARHADLSFYDLSGRLVDRVTAIGSNAILWRPKARGKGCFIVSAKIDGEAYSAKFLTR